MSSTYLQDQVVAITGGSRGIGLATARALVERGARVAILARTPESIDRAVEELGADQAMGCVVDVRDRTGLERAFEQVMERWGRLDGLINNAGFQFARSIETMSEEELRQLLDLNFTSVVLACQCAIPLMRRQGGGRIINLSSASVRNENEFADLGIYSAAKAAVDQFTLELRRDLKYDGIMVTLFSPGAVATGSIDNFDPEAAAAAMEKWQRTGPTFDGAIQPEVVGRALAHCMDYPPGVAVEFMEVRPNQPMPKALETDWDESMGKG